MSLCLSFVIYILLPPSTMSLHFCPIPMECPNTHTQSLSRSHTTRTGLESTSVRPKIPYLVSPHFSPRPSYVSSVSPVVLFIHVTVSTKFYYGRYSFSTWVFLFSLYCSPVLHPSPDVKISLHESVQRSSRINLFIKLFYYWSLFYRVHHSHRSRLQVTVLVQSGLLLFNLPY